MHNILPWPPLLIIGLPWSLRWAVRRVSNSAVWNFGSAAYRTNLSNRLNITHGVRLSWFRSLEYCHRRLYAPLAMPETVRKPRCSPRQVPLRLSKPYLLYLVCLISCTLQSEKIISAVLQKPAFQFIFLLRWIRECLSTNECSHSAVIVAVILCARAITTVISPWLTMVIKFLVPLMI